MTPTGPSREAPTPRGDTVLRTWLGRLPASGRAVRVVEELPLTDTTAADNAPRRWTAMAADRILVQLLPGVAVADAAAAAAGHGNRLGARLTVDGLYEVHLGAQDLNSVPDALAALTPAIGRVLAFAEPDYLLRACIEPDDPRYDELWGLHNTGQSGGVADTDLDAPEGWDVCRDAATVVVAVVDSGIRATHEDLQDNMWTNAGETPGDGVDNDGNGYIDDIHGVDATTSSSLPTDPDDDNGHGTHCAGTIGARGNNATGVTGVAWQVQLMACKFLASDGSGFTSDAVECVEYARNMGADVISNSWEGPSWSTSLYNAIEAARLDGILFVAAAGNSGQNLDNDPSYPACYPNDNVVSVAGINRWGQLSSFSNYGLTTVDVGAPGEDILSTYSTGDASYQYSDGTSMAAPHVSGLLALLAARAPGETYDQLIQRLYEGATALNALDGYVGTGAYINIEGAVAATGTDQIPRITQPLTDTVVQAGDPLQLDVTAIGTAPLSYRWEKDGATLGGEETSSYSMGTTSAADQGLYRVTVSNDIGSASSAATVHVALTSTDIGDAVEAPALTWETYGDDVWNVTALDVAVGVSSAASGALGDGEAAHLRTALTGPGALSFYWRVSSEAGYDELAFALGGVEQASISGEPTWTRRYVSIPAGTHVVSWTYRKDASTSQGDDRGYVDGVSYTPGDLVPPSITTHPRAIIAEAGSDVEFMVEASGTAPFDYSWFHDGVELTGEEGASLILTGVSQAANGGEYTVTVSNAAGTATSNPEMLTVDSTQEPRITTHPASQTAYTGQTTSLSVEAAGTEPFTYQWYRDGTETGDDQAVLTLADVSGDDAGDYTVRVDNVAGNTTSETATLTVSDVSVHPVITKQPQGTTVDQGDDLALSVSAVGALPLSYQWYRDSQQVAGGTSAVLDLSPASTAERGDYTVRVTNPFGSVLSNAAHVEVNAVDAGLADALDEDSLTWTTGGDALWAWQVDITNDGVDAAACGTITHSQSASFTTQVTGPGTLSFFWKVTSETYYDFLDFRRDGLLIDYIDGTVDWTQVVYEVPAGTHTLQWIFDKDESVTVANEGAWVDQVVWAPAGTDAPRIVTQPTDAIVQEGGSVPLSVAAAGASPLAYQWYVDGQPIDDSDSAEFVVAPAHLGNAGNYTVRVGNAIGTEFSDAAVVTVTDRYNANSDAVDTVPLLWSDGGNADWFVQADTVYSGQTALRSGAVADDETSRVSVNVQGPADVAFQWRASSENGYDYLRVFVDSTTFASDDAAAELTGNTTWQRVRLPLDAGWHTLTWEYSKDYISSDGQDCGWIDALEVRRTQTHYSTGFETAEGFTYGEELRGQDGWQALQQGSNGLGRESGDPLKQFAYIGYFAPPTPTGTQELWHDVAYTPDGSGTALRFSVSFGLSLSVDGNTNPTGLDDAFRWTLCAPDGTALFSIRVQTPGMAVSYVLEDGTSHDTGVSLPVYGYLTDFHDLVVVVDGDANLWSAWLDGDLLVNDEPVSTGGAGADIGSVRAGWNIDDPNNPGSNVMDFDDIRVETLEALGRALFATDAFNASAAVGKTFTYRVTAAMQDGSSPTVYSATGLPGSLDIDTAGGWISGTPTTGGTTQITIGAAAGGASATATLTLTTTADPGILYVDQDAPGPGEDGLGWDTAYTTIQGALAAARHGDEIWVADGTYSESLSPPDGVAIYGGFAGGETARDDRQWWATPATVTPPAGSPAVLLDASRYVTIDGLRLTGASLTGTDWSTNAGGGVRTWLADSTNVVRNCTVSACTVAGDGGGLFLYRSDVNLQNSLLTGSSARNGGALYAYRCNQDTTLCTLYGNTASADGGGIAAVHEGTLSINNSILWGNTAAAVGNQYATQGTATVAVTHTCLEGGLNASNLVSGDPLFTDAPGGDFTLVTTSPCIDAGNDALVPTAVDLDLGGGTRVRYAAVDLGAYEWVNTPPTITGQDVLSTPEDTPLVLQLDDVTATDTTHTFPDDHTLSVDDGDHFSGAGTTITPDQDYYGTLQVPVRISDGIDESNTYTLDVTVTPVNDPPVLDLDGDTEGTGFAGTYVGGDGATAAVDSATLALTDLEGTGVTGATITVVGAPDAPNEWLDVDTGTTGIGMTYDETAGILQLTGAASESAYESVLRTLTYRNDAVVATLGDRDLTIAVHDGETTASATAAITVYDSLVLTLNPGWNFVCLPFDTLDGLIAADLFVNQDDDPAYIGDVLEYDYDLDTYSEAAPPFRAQQPFWVYNPLPEDVVLQPIHGKVRSSLAWTGAWQGAGALDADHIASPGDGDNYDLWYYVPRAGHQPVTNGGDIIRGRGFHAREAP